LRIYLTRTNPLRPRQWAGVSRYTACLLRAMRQQSRGVEFFAPHFSLRGRPPGDAERLKAEFGVEIVTVRWPDFSGFAGYYEWLDRFVVPRVADRLGAQIVWGTNCGVPSSRGRRYRSVVTIHDLFLLEHPELSDPAFHRHTLRQVRSLERGCDLVLTDSELSREQIVAQLRFPRDRIVVTPLAPATTIVATGQDHGAARVLARIGISPPFLLSVGTVEARKNYLAGMQAFAELRTRLDANLAWLIVGGRGWQAEAVDAERDRLGLSACVHIRHDVTDEELAALYRAATCLFFPSPNEGFGLPAVEAFAHELPVVAARAGALPEVVGDAAELVDPHSPTDMANGLMRVIADASRRVELIARGRERVRRFSWSAAAATVLDAFGRLIA